MQPKRYCISGATISSLIFFGATFMWHVAFTCMRNAHEQAVFVRGQCAGERALQRRALALHAFNAVVDNDDGHLSIVVVVIVFACALSLL